MGHHEMQARLGQASGIGGESTCSCQCLFQDLGKWRGKCCPIRRRAKRKTTDINIFYITSGSYIIRVNCHKALKLRTELS